MVATNKSTQERWFLRRECYTKYKRGNDKKFKEKFKPTEQSMLLNKWPKLFDLEMKGDQDKATVLAQMAMMCPGKPATLVEIKEICQETTFYSPFCPGKTDATNMDAQPLDADEVHVINTKYIALKAAFDAERANQNINTLVMGAQDSLVAQGNANQTAIHKEGADTRAHITSALAPFKALFANPTEVEQAAVETNDVNEKMNDESVAVETNNVNEKMDNEQNATAAIETNDVNEKMDDEQNGTVAVETNDANEQAVLVETKNNGEGRRRKRYKSSMGKTREQLADELAMTKDELRKTKAKLQKAMQYIRELEEAKETATVETLPNSGQRGMADDKPKRSLANETASNGSSSYSSYSSNDEN